MVAILAHVRIKPDRLAQFEAIERDMAAHTHAGEPDCLRYECWRAEEENKYYVFLAFTDVEAFFNHQVSDWHEGHLAGLTECFADVRLEMVDPVPGAAPGLPPTRAHPLGPDASRRAREYEEQFPIIAQAWWEKAGRAG